MASLYGTVDSMHIFLAVSLGTFVVSYLSVAAVRRWALAHRVIDVPGERSSHAVPTPRGGGIGMVFAFYLVMLWTYWQLHVEGSVYWALLITAIPIAALGFFDDLRNLPRRYRFAAWIVIAIGAMILGIRLTYIELPVIGRIDFGFWSYPLSFLWLIGVTNFYNFMDGIDGLAGGEAVIVGIFFALVAFGAGNRVIAVTSLAIAGCAFGFLLHNLPPARIFMGDGGSNFLGYLLAALGVIGAEHGTPPIPFLVMMLLLGMFLFDATLVLLKHLPRGRNWLEPHRDHYYQRLIRLGYAHLYVTALYWAGSFLLGSLALLYLATTDWLALLPLLLSVVLILAVILGVNFLERRQSSARPSRSIDSIRE